MIACPLCASHSTSFFTDPKNYQHTYRKCPTCDLVFVVPACRLNPDEEKARYEMHRNGNSDDYIAFLSRLANPMLEHLKPASRGLDFGSGKSEAMANLFRQQGHQCDCYDVYFYPDESLLAQQYDFIIASEVIEHLYEPRQTIRLWLDLLSPGGLLGIMTGVRPPDTKFPNWWYKNDPTHVSLFSRETFAYLQQQYQLPCIVAQGNVSLLRKPSILV